MEACVEGPQHDTTGSAIFSDRRHARMGRKGSCKSGMGIIILAVARCFSYSAIFVATWDAGDHAGYHDISRKKYLYSHQPA